MTWASVGTDLSDREVRVLEAVIETYVETAEPAGSRTIAKRFNLGVSAATIRNTMSDLEERGYLFHPHTSAGRIPTDRAYRFFVDKLMASALPTPDEQYALDRELTDAHVQIENILKKAADVLGVLTQELGVAVAPSVDHAVLERLELVDAAADRVLIVLLLRGGAAKTIFVETRSQLPREALATLASVLNERLSGLTLRQVRATVRERLRDVAVQQQGHELLNIFVQEADSLFHQEGDGPVVLGSATMLADQPEFSSNDRMRNLLELTEHRDVLRRALMKHHGTGVTVTIGAENADPKLEAFTLVTSTYENDSLSGIIGVMGPTRMPYQKVIALVGHTSRLMGVLSQ